MVRHWSWMLLASWIILTGCHGLGDAQSQTEAPALVLVRAGDAESRAIAEAYLSAHARPHTSILELALTGPNLMTEIDADTYRGEIAAPVEAHLREIDPDGETTLLLTTRGIPLRIGRCSEHKLDYPRHCESAAVDAALAQLGRTSDPNGAFERRANPYFGDPRPFAEYRAEAPEAALRFLVARIHRPAAPANSPPTPVATSPPTHVRNEQNEKIDSASFPGPYWEVLGEQPPDRRSTAEALLLGPVATRLKRLGHKVCDGCEEDDGATTASGIVLSSTDAERKSTAAQRPLAAPGLVISLAGTPIDHRFDAFVERWRARGARAFSMHLADPSLAGVARPDSQLVAWARGRSAVEAHFSSLPQLGWVNLFVGDPLLTLAATRPLDPSKAESAVNTDRDDDGIPDTEDNCPHTPNVDQRDTNADGIGNRCDADVNNDGQVDTSWGVIYPRDARGDLEAIRLTAENGPYDPNHDLDGDGRVDDRDLVLAELALFRPPGR